MAAVSHYKRVQKLIDDSFGWFPVEKRRAEVENQQSIEYYCLLPSVVHPSLWPTPKIVFQPHRKQSINDTLSNELIRESPAFDAEIAH